MSKIEKIEDILAWQKGRVLTKEIYKATETPKFSKDFALKDQIRRAAISITSNIAEGFGRNGNREFLQFLSIAKASASELRSQLYLALDLTYITEEEFNLLNNLAIETGKIISGFMNYIKQSELKGSKFKSLN